MSRSGETRVLVDTIDGKPIGKVNFVLRDSRDRLWLTVSTRTVESHVGHILRKLDARNRAEAAQRYRGEALPGA